jgi:hypothetical protein
LELIKVALLVRLKVSRESSELIAVKSRDSVAVSASPAFGKGIILVLRFALVGIYFEIAI